MEKETIDLIDRLTRWARQDWWVIVVAVMCLLACLYTINSVRGLQDQINQAWMEQWESSGCAQRWTSVPNITFNLRGEYQNEIKDRNQNTTGPG
jgi:hypothetical protein